MAYNKHVSHWVIFIVLLGLTLEGATQADWLQRGKDLLGGFGKHSSEQSQLNAAEIGSGLKEALRVGTETVVARLGKPDGFNADPKLHIPLPQSMHTVKSMLDKVGMGASLDELELRLNRAAEAATPQAKQLFWNSIKEMTLDDVTSIYNGPNDAATRYFQKKMTPQLTHEMQPVVEQSMSEVGAIQAYDKVMNQYKELPFVPDVKADLTSYVVEKATGGIFQSLAQQEAEIRKNPAKQTTDLLKRVFGSE